MHYMISNIAKANSNRNSFAREGQPCFLGGLEVCVCLCVCVGGGSLYKHSYRVKISAISSNFLSSFFFFYFLRLELPAAIHKDAFYL